MAKQQGALFKKMIEQNRLRISLKELSIASGVSGRQLRYWEQKGYIKSEQSEVGKAHKYTLQTMYAVITIKNFLDQGYTLAKAVEIEKRHRRVRQTVRRFIRNNILKVQESEDALRVNIGQLADHPEYDVEVVVAAPQEKVELRLVEHQERKSGKNGRKD
ncbi:MerR family transcriptional regulator [[Lactobacillus] timonensis]|jgi:DNA-binding transcriptional MerR regulator|uniref:MerR family transcriptional regulator n=1 Tax=[Lactobacillus] timonensis TaxID=1970790 RepID=UPI000C865756|nr:MerR family transcriptional regulator [[Lactobacillus] timonensis]